MGVWEAMEMLNTLVDESDPDVSGAFSTLLILSDKYISDKRVSN